MIIISIIIFKIDKFVNKLLYLYNNFMILSAKEVVKLLLTRELLTQKKLTEILSERSGKFYSPEVFSRKLTNGTITYNEVAMIADILGYEIKVEPK